MESDPAKEALFFMAVGLQGYWKLPLGYALVSKCGATLQAQLLKDIITKLHKVGVDVKSVTFDGLATNAAMCDKLGACLRDVDKLKLKPNFPHPDTQNKIHIFYDPCHIMKLLRTAIAETCLETREGLVNWDLITHIHSSQEDEGLKMANKLTREHIDYHRSKMKVRLAVQVLSSSVAKSIQLLMRLRHSEEFIEGQATISCLEVRYNFMIRKQALTNWYLILDHNINK